jgi:glycosyltransferase involved in cell wall biosynthesis
VRQARILIGGDFPLNPPVTIGGIQAVTWQLASGLQALGGLDLHVSACEKWWPNPEGSSWGRQSTESPSRRREFAGLRRPGANDDQALQGLQHRPPALAERVAFFLPSLAAGGAERVFLDLAYGFLARGLRVDLVLVREEGPLLSGVPSGIRMIPLRAARTATAVVPLARYLRRERPKAMLSALTHANVVAIIAHRLAHSGTRLVVTEHVHLSTSLGSISDVRARLIPQLIRRLYPLADSIVAVSEGVADDLARRTGLDRASILVEYNPVIVAELRQKAAERLDHPWFAAGQPPVVLGIGRLTEQKDFGTLIRAFRLAHEQEACRLMILGEGELRAPLEGLADSLGVRSDVELPGFVRNPYPYFASAGAFALSSRWEGLPTVLLEAVCLRVPIVSTDCHSGPREILEDGSLGRLVPVGDWRALAEAIVATLRDRHARPPAAACERYRLERVVERYAQIVGLSGEL